MGAYWATAGLVSRIALVCGALSLLINIGTYWGLALDGRGWALILLHPLLMVLGTIAFGATLRYRWLTKGLRLPSLPRVSPAWPVVVGAGVTAVYLNVLMDQPQHADVVTDAAVGLRLLSAGWLFISLAISAWAHVLWRRIRSIRSTLGM